MILNVLWEAALSREKNKACPVSQLRGSGQVEAALSFSLLKLRDKGRALPRASGRCRCQCVLVLSGVMGSLCVSLGPLLAPALGTWSQPTLGDIRGPRGVRGDFRE